LPARDLLEFSLAGKFWRFEGARRVSCSAATFRCKTFVIFNLLRRGCGIVSAAARLSGRRWTISTTARTRQHGLRSGGERRKGGRIEPLEFVFYAVVALALVSIIASVWAVWRKR
jgi:hypothetical protein